MMLPLLLNIIVYHCSTSLSHTIVQGCPNVFHCGPVFNICEFWWATRYDEVKLLVCPHKNVVTLVAFEIPVVKFDWDFYWNLAMLCILKV